MEQCFRDVGFHVKNLGEVAEAIEKSKNTVCHEIGKKRYFCGRFDDCISLWIELDEDEYSDENGAVVEYTDGNIYGVLALEAVEGGTRRDFVSLRLKGVSYPIDVQLVCRDMATELEEDVEYVANVACFALKIEFFESIFDYMDAFENLSVKAVYPLGYELENTPPIIIINGVIKSYKKKINPCTGRGYYHLDVETLEKSLVILAEETLVPTTIYEGMIVSATCWCTASVTQELGNSWSFDYDESTDANEFIQEVSRRITSLRDMFYEHVCVSFSPSTSVDNITFVQTARNGTHYLVEIGKTVNGEPHLFRIEEVELLEAIKLFSKICVEKKTPDTSKWKDVTNIIKKN